MTEIITPFARMDLVAGANQQKGVSSAIKFGYNPDLAVDVEEDITTFGGTYQFLSDSGEEVQLVSDNAGDNQLIVLSALRLTVMALSLPETYAPQMPPQD